ncbi:MAG TPA: hypothetical protein VFV87_12530 [Pirellulaceae bacterium]|nr:hypothetical protein [Pirellulaceae bacterium]
MMTRRWTICCSLVCSAALSASPLAGQEPEPELTPVDKQQIEAALKLTKAEAAKYVFEIGKSDAKPELQPEPLLRWSNPSVGEVHGYVFLWTVNERPAVVGSLFKWFTPHTHMSHEFHSLSEAPLSGKYDGAEKWKPRSGGVAFARLPNAPALAATPALRLLQMKRFAKEFAATKKERDDSRQELRLLTQPIYRYADPKGEIADGGLFAFVQGTDPELFLLLEARGKGEAASWQFAAARMNGVGFDLRYQDKAVWSVEIMPGREIYSHLEPYTSFMFNMP